MVEARLVQRRAFGVMWLRRVAAVLAVAGVACITGGAFAARSASAAQPAVSVSGTQLDSVLYGLAATQQLDERYSGVQLALVQALSGVTEEEDSQGEGRAGVTGAERESLVAALYDSAKALYTQGAPRQPENYASSFAAFQALLKAFPSVQGKATSEALKTFLANLQARVKLDAQAELQAINNLNEGEVNPTLLQAPAHGQDPQAILSDVVALSRDAGSADPALAGEVDAATPGVTVTPVSSTPELESALVKSDPAITELVAEIAKGEQTASSLAVLAKHELVGLRNVSAEAIKAALDKEEPPAKILVKEEKYEEVAAEHLVTADAAVAISQETGSESVSEAVAQQEIAMASAQMIQTVVQAAVIGAQIGIAILDPASAGELLSNIASFITSFFEPNPTEEILDDLQLISEQIHELAVEVREGFQGVNASLDVMTSLLGNIEEELKNKVVPGIGELARKTAALQEQVTQLQANVFLVATTDREEELKEAQEKYIGYRWRNHASMSLSDFNSANATFYHFGHDLPTDPIAENTTCPTTLAQDFETLSGPSKSTDALNFNLDCLIGTASESHWGDGLSFLASPVNPTTWVAGANAWAQLISENPEYITEGVLARTGQLTSVGASLVPDLKALAAEGPNYNKEMKVRGVNVDTRSSVLNHALADYLEAGHVFLERAEGEENTVLASEHPAEDVAETEGVPCKPDCHLGESPTEVNDATGRALIDPWQPAEQAPSKSLPLLEVAATATQKGETLHTQGQIDTCTPTENTEGGTTTSPVPVDLEPQLSWMYPHQPPESIPGTEALDERYGHNSAVKARWESENPWSKLEGYSQAATELHVKEMLHEGNPLLDPLPNVFANAWHLGLGYLTACTTMRETGGGPLIEEFASRRINPNAQMHLAVKWFWTDYKKPQIKSPVLSLEMTSNSGPKDVYSLRFLGQETGELGEVGCDNHPPYPQWFAKMWSAPTAIPGYPKGAYSDCASKESAALVPKPYGDIPYMFYEGDLALALGTQERTNESHGEFGFGTNQEAFPSLQATGATGASYDLYDDAHYRPSVEKEESAMPWPVTKIVATVQSVKEEVTTEVEASLKKLRRSSYEAIAPKEDEHLSKTKLETPAKELDGARSLLDAYVQLGMSASTTKDPVLNELLSGPNHLLDNSPEGFDVYNYFNGGVQKEEEEDNDGVVANPVGGGGALTEKIDTGSTEVSSRANEDLTRVGPLEQLEQGDPVFQGTVSRVELTGLAFAGTGDAVGSAPAVSRAPEVSGTPALGQALTCSQGTWTGSPAPTFKYAWLRDGAQIEAATTSTYTVVEADQGHSLACRVTATNSQGRSEAVSSNSLAIPAAPAGVQPLLGVNEVLSFQAKGTPLSPDSGFSAVAASVNQHSGLVTFKETVSQAGTFSWLLTFQNGKFGVYAASTETCKKGQVKLTGKCRPALIVFAKGSRAVAAAGTFTFVVKPSASALKALQDALKHHNALPVTANLTFQSSLGGSPVSHTQKLTVKLKKSK